MSERAAANKTVIAVDLMGGDDAPYQAVDGCVGALEEGISVLALGNLEAVELLKSKTNHPNLTTLVCTQVITAEESPVRGVKAKSDSTIVKGLSLVKSGQASGFVSAGSTGALLAGGVLILGRAKGVDRPCLGMVLPSENGRGVLVMDLGASYDVRPSNLVEFALMGSIYAERVLRWSGPRIGLLNIGTESNKGTQTIKKAYRLMEKAPINFVGNVEARDVFFDKADIVITDGFCGNVLLKASEGALLFQTKYLRDAINRGTTSKIGALFLRPVFEELTRSFDYSTYGGAPMLGLEGCLVKCHGSSKGLAITNGIEQATRFVEGNVASVISETISEMGFEESEQ